MENNEVFQILKSKVTIKQVVSHFYQDVDRRNKALCPFHHEKTPSFSIDENEGIFKCFGCGAGGDCISFVAKLKNVEMLEAAKMIDYEFNLGLFDEDKSTKKKVNKAPAKKVEKPKEQVNPEELKKIKEYLQECINNVDKQNYLKTRGFTLEMVKKFKLGYDVNEDAITIPYNNALTYYQRRYVATKRFYKPEKSIAGEEHLYNESALTLKIRTPIFIVESPFCAMSIIELGGNALATCGTGCLNKLRDAIKKHKPKGTLIFCFDNDDAGEKANEDIEPTLKELGVKYIFYNICPGYKDPNEAFVANRNILQIKIHQAIIEASKLTATKFDIQSARDLQEKEIPPQFWVIDGMLPEGLTFLTAAGKVGKSWMGQQICINVANGTEFLGHKTTQCSALYLALEDSERRIKSRMNIYLQGQKAPKNYFYCVYARTLDTGLLEDLENYLIEQPTIKLIIIDTFQKVRGLPLKNETQYATDYRECGVLKALADRHHISILILHHIRKMSDAGDVLNMMSGTNGISGSLDTAWMLVKKNRMDVDATLFMVGRDVSQNELVITKGETNGRWDVVGTVEEQEAKHRKEKYEKNPVVIAIKKVLQDQSTFIGTTQQFRLLCLNKYQIVMTESDTKIGKELNSLTYDLALDGIVHEYPTSKSSKGKKHLIAKKNPYTGQPDIPSYE